MMEHNILQKYIEGKATQLEKENIAQWLDADDENMQEFLLLRSMYDISLWNSSVAHNHKKKNSGKRIVSFLVNFSKIAAAFILGIGSYHLLSLTPSENIIPPVSMQTVYVPEGQRAEILLSDSTKVWLNAKTSLTFPTQFSNNNRKVELNGEAYFDVSRDESKQFIVSTGNYQVTVLGTEFNVKAYADKSFFEAALLKGSIDVLSQISGEHIRLLPGMKVDDKDGKLNQSRITHYDHYLWREGLIAFDGELVRDIFEKVELYYDVKIIVNNIKILDTPYTGKFRTKDGVEHVLKVLQLRHNFKYKKDNDSNIITIN